MRPRDGMAWNAGLAYALLVSGSLLIVAGVASPETLWRLLGLKKK